MDKSIASRTFKILKEHSLKLKKSLGQNFLTDTNTLQKIVSAANLRKDSCVIEIGPGIGALTELILEQAAYLAAIELDPRIVDILLKSLGDNPNFHVIHRDVLEADLVKLVTDAFPVSAPVHVIANLPYYITSPVIIKILRELPFVENIVVMIQKEVAQRLMAVSGTKSYGYLTTLVQFYANVEKIADVSRNLFVPVPNVDSTVIKLTPKTEKVSVKDEHFLFKVIQASFANRRKTLLNSLSANLNIPLNKETLNKILVNCNIDGCRRGETLSLDEFALLTDALLE